MWSKAIAKANSITLHHQIKRQMICWQTEKDETNPALCSNLIQNRTCTTLCVHWTVCAIHIQCCTAADVRCTARWRRRCWRSWVAGVIIIFFFFFFSWWAVYLHSCTTLPQLNCASLLTEKEAIIVTGKSFCCPVAVVLLSSVQGTVVSCLISWQCLLMFFSALLFLSFFTATIFLSVFYFSTRHISAINIHTHTTRHVHKYTRLSTTPPPQ